MQNHKTADILTFGRLRYLSSNDLFKGALNESHPLASTRVTLAHGNYFGGAFDPDKTAACDHEGPDTTEYKGVHSYIGMPSRREFELTKIALKRSGVMDWAHEHGIAVVSYNAGARFGGWEEDRNLFFEFYDKHWQEYEDYFGPKPAEDPVEWTRRLSSGQKAVYTPQDTMVREYNCCINNSHICDYVKGTIRISLELGVDGIFFDYSPQFCYCGHCIEKFREHLRTNFPTEKLQEIFGINDPARADPVLFTRQRSLRFENPLYMEWRRFRPQNYLQWLKEMRDYGRSLNKDFFISANACLWEGNPFRQFEFTVGPLEEWSKETDYLFIEAMFEASPHGHKDLKITNSPVLKYAAAASRGKNVAYDGYLTWGKTPAAMIPLTKLAVAECLANRATFMHNWSPKQNLPWGEGGKYIIADLTSENEAVLEGLKEYNGFFVENEGLLLGSEPRASVGVLCSLQQAYGKRKSSYMALSRMLSDEQIPHVALIDDDLTSGRLSAFSALILPEVPLMSDAQVEAVIRFVRDGGGLVVLGETAAYDEYGRRRKEFYGLHKLMEDLEPWGHIDIGVDPAVGVNTTGKAEYGLGRVVNIPQDAYVSFPDIGREKVVLFKDMASITTGAMKSINTVFAEIVRWVAKGNLSGACLADSTVEFTIMDQPDQSRTIAHLVNYKVNLDGSVTEEKDIKLEVTVPRGKKPRSVRLVSPDFTERRELGFELIEGNGSPGVRFVVPRLVIYSLAFIEYTG
ncbi:MAG: hypothetical protein FIA99_05080 [Ruminiclostridium sp.]|nr:hypothetical protein [Ruminiclostridium sp.]